MAKRAPSKFAENPFEMATRNRFPRMNELLAQAVPTATAVTAGIAAFSGVLGMLTAADASWSAGESRLTSAEAAFKAATFGFEDQMARRRRRPDADTPSLLEQWETTIRSQVAYRGPIYLSLLPQGRRTLTQGRYEAQLDAVRDFGKRLSQQSAKPALVALGVTVTTYATAVRTLRETQGRAESELKLARLAQESNRLTAAAALYALVGMGMVVWCATPERVDTLFDRSLLRQKRQPKPPSAPPEPPAASPPQTEPDRVAEVLPE